jgi:hypothetical protein
MSKTPCPSALVHRPHRLGCSRISTLTGVAGGQESPRQRVGTVTSKAHQRPRPLPLLVLSHRVPTPQATLVRGLSPPAPCPPFLRRPFHSPARFVSRPQQAETHKAACQALCHSLQVSSRARTPAVSPFGEAALSPSAGPSICATASCPPGPSSLPFHPLSVPPPLLPPPSASG